MQVWALICASLIPCGDYGEEPHDTERLLGVYRTQAAAWAQIPPGDDAGWHTPTESTVSRGSDFYTVRRLTVREA